jgi:hypothetical protein
VVSRGDAFSLLAVLVVDRDANARPVQVRGEERRGARQGDAVRAVVRAAALDRARHPRDHVVRGAGV